jgi:hypothetical protein
VWALVATQVNGLAVGGSGSRVQPSKKWSLNSEFGLIVFHYTYMELNQKKIATCLLKIWIFLGCRTDYLEQLSSAHLGWIATDFELKMKNRPYIESDSNLKEFGNSYFI